MNWRTAQAVVEHTLGRYQRRVRWVDDAILHGYPLVWGALIMAWVWRIAASGWVWGESILFLILIYLLFDTYVATMRLARGG